MTLLEIGFTGGGDFSSIIRKILDALHSIGLNYELAHTQGLYGEIHYKDGPALDSPGVESQVKGAIESAFGVRFVKHQGDGELGPSEEWVDEILLPNGWLIQNGGDWTDFRVFKSNKHPDLTPLSRKLLDR